jgi:hypothetical protein
MPTLHWLTRDNDLSAGDRVPYRLLEEVPDLGGGDRETGNMLIQGDNLDALKALMPFYAGQVKCIFIDPPYNTRSAFEHYDDNLEHSKWLAQKLESKIKALRQEAQEKAYQLCLFSPEARTNVSFEEGFKFSKDIYFDVRKHRGGAFRFRHHFLGPDDVPAFSGMEGDVGEEFTCAQMLDSLNDKVEFWIRNVAQHKNSFRLPLASGFFYPDFVAKLKDGRIFVVEYKGEHLAGSGNDDTNEKRLVGALWQKASEGKGLFAMIEKDVAGRNMRDQLLDAINQKP